MKHAGTDRTSPGLGYRAVATPTQSVPAEGQGLEDRLQAGLALQREGKFLDAERIYQGILQRDPDHAEALNLMGSLALEAQEAEIAIEYFSKAVTLRPKNAVYHHNLGNTYLQLRNFGLAIRHLSKAIELKPNLVDGLCNLARCYVLMNAADMALPLYRKALRLDPNHRLVAIGLGNALVNLGKMEEAELYLRRAIDERTAVADGFLSLVSLKTFEGRPPELDAILSELNSRRLEERQLGNLHHAVGKILNDLKCYEEAVDHFSLAKEISGNRFDIQAYRAWVDEMIALFNPLFMGSRAGFGDPSEVPVFIVGMPRSGTTLTEQIIASHGEAHGAGELHKMRQIAQDMGLMRQSLSKFARTLTSLTQEQSRTLAQDYLKFIRRYSRNAFRIVDKMPHNFELVGLIRLLFPNARIVHVRRNPMDTCVSCFMNAFSEAHGYNADLDKLGLYYREYDRLMRHWDKVLPGQIFLNRYEDLIADQEQQSRRLLAHVGLAWDPACVNFHETARTVQTISRWQVRQPIYRSSLQRWKHYGDKLQPLVDALGDLATAG